MEQVDCIIAGAGVIGLAIARKLAALGLETLIVEAADAIGTETSSRNSEVIHAGIYYPQGSLKARLCVAGRDMLYRYCADRSGPSSPLRQADCCDGRDAGAGAGRHSRQRRGLRCR